MSTHASPSTPTRRLAPASAEVIATSALIALAVAGLLGAGDRTLSGLVFAAVFAAALLLRIARTPARTPPVETQIDAAQWIERIDQRLPQTQCGQCGYPGCRPYAEAIAQQQADINQCPPGGDAGIRALAELLGREVKPLNPANGVEKPKALAVIDEATCIGCTKCIQACPVDAILGGPKLMHTVIAELCTGCELCLPPCPVDCIAMVVPESQQSQS
jgi:electron transport complex protein RnfB